MDKINKIPVLIENNTLKCEKGPVYRPFFVV